MEIPEFDTQLWLLNPVPYQCKSCETSEMTQVFGFLPLVLDMWMAFQAPGFDPNLTSAVVGICRIIQQVATVRLCLLNKNYKNVSEKLLSEMFSRV